MSHLPLSALLGMAVLTLSLTFTVPAPVSARSAHAFRASAAPALDLTGDKAIDLRDAQAFLRCLADGAPPSGVSDLDGDGSVGLSDALLYGRWINGLYEKPAAGLATLYFRNPADTAAFAAYQADLRAKSAWTLADLKQAYPSSAAAGVNYAAGQIQFESEVANAFAKRTPGWNKDLFLSKVRSQGVAVSAATSFPNFFQALDYIHTSDLPLMFTTDAMLHSIYLSYDNILMELETNLFSATLEKILFASLKYAEANYRVQGDQSGADVRDMLSIGLLLVDPKRSDVVMTPQMTAVLASIKAEQLGLFTMYGMDTLVDWTQFKPRGHYTKSPKLSAYFQAMMWLSRADLAFDLRAQPKGTAEPAFTRMKKDALILWDCVVNSGSYPGWLEFNGYVEYLVGMSDGLNMRGMGSLARSLGIESVPEYLAAFPEAKFDSAMAKGRYGAQAILSQAKQYPPGGAADLGLSPNFSFMPQRFILDSYTFSQAVFPLTGAIMPSSLQIAFALGDNSALDDLAAAQSGAKVPGVLGAQRRLYDAISEEGWQSNLYTSWLGFLRKLNPPIGNVSPVFKGAAWQSKMRNTRLASWAQLRHNTILYAKQSFTGGIICSFPRAYVEPYPDFFAAVMAYARIGSATFKTGRPAVAAYFTGLEAIAGRLRDVAGRTAQGLAPTDEQAAWLKTALQSTPPMVCGGARVYDGWFLSLMYGSRLDYEKGTDYTIADVHTHIEDEQGPNLVLHVATGAINLAAVAVQEDSCVSLYVAPVGSYYDVLRTGTLTRYNDEEWTVAVDKHEAIVTRPPWTATMIGP
ncbi:MAG: DUF3160 domain-containing protein [Fibrobacteria bacterium]